jgi:HSP20 family protein
MLDLWNVLNDVMRTDPWFAPFSVPPAALSSTIVADVAESDAEYWIMAELPGVPLENVKVEIEGDVLTLSAIKQPLNEAGRNYRHVERRYGNSTRTFSLPKVVNRDEVQANMKDGVLTIRVPKAEAARPRRIPVRIGALETGGPAPAQITAEASERHDGE